MPQYNGPMKVISLQSGSNGNSIYVEAGSVRLLFDAGISGVQVQERLAIHGRDVSGISALLISHDHVDHSGSMGIYHRKFGVPVYVTAKTYRAASRYGLGAIGNLNHFCAGATLRFGKVVVETISTPHDGVDGVVFVVDDGTHRLGVLTDLGHVFDDLEPVIMSLDAVLLESNYDPKMLANGDYPAWLKKRIEGPGGHISNIESAELLRTAASPRMQWACLSHLSGDNNTPKLALETHRQILGKRLPLYVATRYEPSGVMEL
jgi:phosphoribosyl 1,2-cyclic phosphodiesterase